VDCYVFVGEDDPEPPAVRIGKMLDLIAPDASRRTLARAVRRVSQWL
jgi:hypothetical protein